jgi:serine/threonine protein kinase
VTVRGRADSFTAERWRRIEELFHATIELDAESRKAFLESACTGDSDLRIQVESLILTAEEPDSAGLLTLTVRRAADSKFELQPGKRVSAYEIIGKLGSGGMGAVYLATRVDDQYRKNVAIKLLEGPATESVLARFRLERQILAGLDHPNIAHLFDAGEVDGWPYLVMEHIEGVPLDAYVRAQNPSLRKRLEIFRDICAAIGFAHRRLVVHRDIKPGNILVTADGAPKLLDFGIAKILEEEPGVGLTRATERIMTPEYASPEQVKGDPITTASDVYSLGIVLYELLTGEQPFQFDASRPLDSARAICEQEPGRPSGAAEGKRRRELKGDLDNIVLMAIRKEPARRYASADALSDDIWRYLNRYPVRARRDTPVYRVGKFLRRNRISAMVTAIAVVLLAIGLFRLQAERSRAQAGFSEVREMANGFLFEFEDAIRNLPGSTAARKLVVARGLEYLARLEKNAGSDTGLRRELADAYSKIGRIQFDYKPPSLYDPEAARESARKEIALREQLLRSGGVGEQARLASAYFRLADLERRLQHRQAADQAHTRGSSIASRLPKDSTADEVSAALVAEQIDVLRSRRDVRAVFDQGNQAIALADRAQANHPEDRMAKIRAILTRAEVARDFIDPNGRVPAPYLDHVMKLNRDAASAVDEWLRRSPGDVDARGLLNRVDEAACGMQEPDVAAALAGCRRIVADLLPVVTADSQDLSSFLSLSATYGNIGSHLTDLGKPNEAVPEFQRGLEMTEAAQRLRPVDPMIHQHLLDFHFAAAGALSKSGNFEAALEMLRRAESVALSINLRGIEEDMRIVEVHARMGDVELNLREPRKAREQYQQASDLLSQWSRRGPLPSRLRLTPEMLRKKLAEATALAGGG